jgi:hypothetical protein
MTSEFDFTNDQWEQVASVPYLVGLAVARAEDSGFIGSHLETRALFQTIAAEPDADPPGSLVAQAATTDVSEAYERFKAIPPDVIGTEAVAACREATSLLGEIADPGEAAIYRRWVLEVAWTVAEAAKEHGDRVSAGEAVLLERIADALDLPAREAGPAES